MEKKVIQSSKKVTRNAWKNWSRKETRCDLWQKGKLWKKITFVQNIFSSKQWSGIMTFRNAFWKCNPIFIYLMEVTGSTWTRAKLIGGEHQGGEGERRERGKKPTTVGAQSKPNFKPQPCTTPCVIKETCLNYTTGVPEALTKDHGQQSFAPHTAGFHIPLQNYQESLKLPQKPESTALPTARHTSHRGGPQPWLKLLGFPGETTKLEAHLQTFKGSKPRQIWWDAKGSVTRGAICSENPTSCLLVRK